MTNIEIINDALRRIGAAGVDTIRYNWDEDTWDFWFNSYYSRAVLIWMH